MQGSQTHIRIHDLRHTYASWVQKKGEKYIRILQPYDP